MKQIPIVEIIQFGCELLIVEKKNALIIKRKMIVVLQLLQ